MYLLLVPVVGGSELVLVAGAGRGEGVAVSYYSAGPRGMAISGRTPSHGAFYRAQVKYTKLIFDLASGTLLRLNCVPALRSRILALSKLNTNDAIVSYYQI